MKQNGKREYNLVLYVTYSPGYASDHNTTKYKILISFEI